MANPFAGLAPNQAAERNKQAILEAWLQLGYSEKSVFEVGSGTGQHGIHLCLSCPELWWQPSETPENFSRLAKWWQAAQSLHLPHFLAPVGYAIGQSDWPVQQFDIVYSSNVLHIISNDLAKQFVQNVALHINHEQLFVCYGPFKIDGEYTTESNREFDQALKLQGYGGLLDVQDVLNWSNNLLKLVAKLPMPANNFIMVFALDEG